MKRALIVGAIILAVVLFLNRGSSADGFRESDPTGYEACSAFDSARGSGGSVYSDRIGRAASLGVDAETSAIRGAIDDGTGERNGDPVVDDLGRFKDACSDAGYNF